MSSTSSMTVPRPPQMNLKDIERKTVCLGMVEVPRILLVPETATRGTREASKMTVKNVNDNMSLAFISLQKKNKIKILVSTSVVEVGIDVPNASLMMIESAERFGLAQLYQLRGRVGRSIHQSYCFIFTEGSGEKTKKRLNALIQAKNGFELAEKDLEIRGPGEIYGLRQSGFLSELKLARLSDYAIIKQSKNTAKEILTNDPDLTKYTLLKEKLENIEKPIAVD